MADNSVETAAAEGTLNTRSKSQVVVAYRATQLYFRPETFEFIIVPEDEAGEFEAHGMDMCKAVADLHQANLGVTNAVERYGSLMDSTDPAALSGAKKDYDKAQGSLEAVAAVLKKKLEGLEPMAKLATGGSGIVELIPVRKQWSNQPKPAGGAATAVRRKYGRKSLFVDSRKIKKSWKTLSARQKNTARSRPRAAPAPGPDHPNPGAVGDPHNPNGQENILVRDANGKHKIDWEKLAKQVKELKLELKAEIASFDENQTNGILFEWAEAMNKDLKWDPQSNNGYFTNNVDLSAQAQLMRYVCGVGAEAAWDPKNGKVGLKAEAKGEFVLAEGKANMIIYAPHRLGWVLRLTSRSGKVYPLGAIRAQLEVVLAGVVGASAVVELAFEIESSAARVGARGVPAGGATPPSVDPNQGPDIASRGLKVSPPKLEAGIFAGAKADLDVSGSLQWLNPEDKKKKFSDFVKIAPGVSAMAGAGATGKLEITYADGRFKLLAEASLCLGAGARGKIGCEANAVLIYEFITWFYYQLYHANFEFLVFVAKSAFEALQQIQFLAIQTGKKAEHFLFQRGEQISDELDLVLEGFQKSEMRNKLAARVLADDKVLRYATPETKGMLLYQLTRHAKHDWVDPGNYSLADAFKDRKVAVLAVLRWVQTLREWDNVLQHVEERGRKSDEDSRAHLIRFLQLGYYDMHDELMVLEARLHSEPVLGRAVAVNDSLEYMMFRSDARLLAGSFVDPLSSMDIVA